VQRQLAPAVCGDPQSDLQVGRGEIGLGAVRPFDDTNSVAVEILVKAGFKKLFGMSEAIKIKVIYRYSRIFIRFDQGISWTLDLAVVSEAAQQAAGQGGLAGAEIAVQIDRQPGGEAVGQSFAGGQRGVFVREVQACGRVAIIFGMSGKHDNPSGGQGNMASLAAGIKAWGRELGFDEVGVADIDLATAEAGLLAWLAAGFHGRMDYMEKHGTKRSRPAELEPGTVRVISARMSYLPTAEAALEVLGNPEKAYISRYALGRDYHKVLRARLQQLADRIAGEIPHAYRVFVDSAPVMEVALAEKAGLGWRGKHSLLLSRQAGSFFFLGEIYTDLPLPVDAPTGGHCGTCSACMPACPTGAIVAPYRVDARRCISYLTIELKESIPEAFRALLGNRIYGCDDCQLVCPWNRFARLGGEADFAPRHGLDSASLVELFSWSEESFRERMAGSPIYRIGHERWLRNIAVALGNGPGTPAVIRALAARADDPSAMLREHVTWALRQHDARPPEGAV